MADISIGFTAWAMQHPNTGAVPPLVDCTCEEQGRDPAGLGRSIGVGVVLPVLAEAVAIVKAA